MPREVQQLTSWCYVNGAGHYAPTTVDYGSATFGSISWNNKGGLSESYAFYASFNVYAGR